MSETLPAQSAVATPSKKPATKTNYLVFKKMETGGWGSATEITATSSMVAMRERATSDGDGGMYVAVPARSWRPILIEFESTVRLKLTSADTNEPESQSESEPF